MERIELEKHFHKFKNSSMFVTPFLSFEQKHIDFIKEEFKADFTITHVGVGLDCRIEHVLIFEDMQDYLLFKLKHSDKLMDSPFANYVNSKCN